MRKLRAFFLRILGLASTKTADAEFANELESHIALDAEDGIRAGLSPAEARRHALIRLGGAEQARQIYRERHTLPWLESLIQDLRYTLRQLRHSPGFTITAIVTLSLGVGAATTMFTVLNGVLLQPLPYPHPDRILYIGSRYDGGSDFRVTRAAQFRFLQERNRSFDSLALNDVVASAVNLSGGSEPEQVKTVSVSADFFKVLGVAPALGRAFTSADESQGGACVAVLTDSLWRSRYNGDRSILHNPITVNRTSCSVVGILPPGFRFQSDAAMFLPLQIAPAPRDLGHYYNLMTRLNPGVTPQQASAELAGLFSQFKATHGDLVDDGEVGFETGRYQDAVLGYVRPTLWALFAAVCLMMSIACVNVAHLQISRVAARTREMAVRAALGASRPRLARQLITESALVAFVGAGLGLLLACFCVPLLRHFSPSGLPRTSDISVDLNVAAFAGALSVLTLLTFGVVPAISGSRTNVNLELKSATHGPTPGKITPLGRDLLIVTEVTLSLILMTGATLIIRSFVGLEQVSPGFDPRDLLTFKLSVPPRYATTAQMWEFERQLLNHIDSIPGVDMAASATSLPLDPGPDMPGVLLGQSPPKQINPAYRPVSPGYFHVLGTTVVRGRSFSESDSANSPPVAIINASLARQAFPDRSPIGQRLQLGAGLGPEFADPPRLIVGVVADVHEKSLDTPAGITVYIPRAQIPDALTPLMNRAIPMSWAIRTRVPPAQLSGAIRRAILEVDSQQPAADMRTMEKTVSAALDRQRFTLLLVTIFASLAMVLAAVGIYGVSSYEMQQRTRELGIRMALGARRVDLMLLVLRRTATLLAIGLIVGFSCSLAASRAIKSLLFSVGQHDPLAMLTACGVLAICGLIASLIPARRAASIDPMQALRAE